MHAYLAGKLRPEWRVLELNCGTGEDAVWLSERVRHVTATDISGEMIRTAEEKCRNAGRTNVTLRQMNIRDLAERGRSDSVAENEAKDGRGNRAANNHVVEHSGHNAAEPNAEAFDLVFSNFDGLNCLHDLSFLPGALRSVLAPEGEAIVVLMSRFCAAEILGFTVRGKIGKAFARFREGGLPVNIGGGTSVTTWFHSTGSMLRLFREGGFRIVAVRGVGLTAPPTSMRDFYHRHLPLFRTLEPIDGALSPHFPFNRMGDHILLHLQVKGEQ